MSDARDQQPPSPYPSPSQTVVRHYTTDANYTADAHSMAAAGWRVIASQRMPDGSILATYALPPGAQPPPPLHVASATVPLHSAASSARRGLNMWWFIGGIVGGVVVLAILGGIVNAAVAGSASSSLARAQATATSVAYATAYAATIQSIASQPTVTPAPTASPTPTLTPAMLDQQIVANLATAKCNFVSYSVTGTYHPATHSVDVLSKVGTQWDISGAQQTVKQTVFQCFEGFYTASNDSFVQDVSVEVDGPITDAYGNHSIGAYGAAELTRATAARFNWSNLDADSAWSNYIYDSQWVRSN